MLCAYFGVGSAIIHAISYFESRDSAREISHDLLNNRRKSANENLPN